MHWAYKINKNLIKKNQLGILRNYDARRKVAQVLHNINKK